MAQFGKSSTAARMGARQRDIAAQTMLTAIVDSSEDAIISKDLNGKISSWNAAATRLFGYTPEEAIGKSDLLTPQELQQEELEIQHRLLAGESIDHYETVRVRKGGERVEVSLTMSPLKDKSGEVVGSSTIVRDITENKRGNAAQTLLAAIVASSDDAIITKDMDGIITSWNAAATSLFGYTAEEAIGKSILILIPPELQHEEVEILRKLRAGERIDHYETVRMKKGGERFEISLTISPLKDALGRVAGASKIARDITERKRAEQALVQSEKLAAVGRMLATIAHEINNPLEAVINLAFLLAHEPSVTGVAHTWAETLLNEVTRMGGITKQTLAFYRSGDSPEMICLPEVLDDLLKLYRPAIEKSRVSVQRKYSSTPEILGFGGELRQVFSNLLLNAIHAAGPSGQLVVRVRRFSRYASGAIQNAVRVTVADSGPGIPASIRSRIFEPFFTTKSKQGTGLGLWVSRGIVTKHGGTLRFRTRSGGKRSGTTFTVLLPCR